MDKNHSFESSSQEENSFNNTWLSMIGGDESLIFPTELNVEEAIVEQNSFTMPENLDANEIIHDVDGSNCQDLLQNVMKYEIVEEGSSNVCDESYNVVQVESSPSAPASLPASGNWLGDFQFDVMFEKQTKKVLKWTYSHCNDKIYVSKDVACPINFSTNTQMPKGVNIRAKVLFSSPDSTGDLVKRCFEHTMEDQTKNISEAKHLVRCESLITSYETDPLSNHHSVVVPFENPPVGQNFSTYIYKFTCLGSCRGIDRKPLMLVFSLEYGNAVIGRRSLNLKICACPTRDKKADEEKILKQEQGVSKKRKIKTEPDTLPGTSSPSKKSKVAPNQDGYYQIKVKDHKCYEFLQQMMKYYDLVKTIKSLPLETREVLEKYQERKGYNVQLP